MCCFEGLKAAALILCERTQRTDVTLFILSWDIAPGKKASADKSGLRQLGIEAMCHQRYR
jgi:hypothetical protein